MLKLERPVDLTKLNKSLTNKPGDSRKRIFRVIKSTRSHLNYHLEKINAYSFDHVNQHDSNGNSILYYVLSSSQSILYCQNLSMKIAYSGYIPFEWEINELQKSGALNAITCRVLKENKIKSKKSTEKILKNFLLNDIVDIVLSYL